MPHEPALRGYLRNQFPSVDHDDVVQESYLKLLRARSIARIVSTKSYLFSIARNTARTIFRRKQIYSTSAFHELPESSTAHEARTAADFAQDQQQQELVAAAIDALPPRCREIIALSVLDGLTSAEIADRLGIAESTVRVQLARGVKKCAAFLQEEGELG